MSKQEQYIEKTLTVPSELPFFHYNFNFEGLRKIVETINVEVNFNRQQINEVTQQMKKKLAAQQFNNMQKSLNNSLILGNQCRKFVEESELAAERMFRKSNQDMNNIQNYCYKVQRLSDIVQYLLIRSNQHHQKIEADDRKYDNKITQSFHRLEEKLDLQNTSFTKTINTYFNETNRKVTDLESNHKGLKLSTQNKFQQMSRQLSLKIGEGKLKNQLVAYEHKIKHQLSSLLDGDHMKRLAALNEYSTKLKQTEKDIDIQQKFLKQKMEEMTNKLSKVLTINSFDTEKHKIFEKLSQFKSKIEDLYRRSQEFSDFRKQQMINNERVKQTIAGFHDDLAKLNDKGSNFKKMETVTEVLAALDPHLICQIGNEVKLHEKQIGKLEKMFMLLQSQFNSNKGMAQNMPQINNGQNADMMTKLIKQYMSNMDFEGRVKKAQRDLNQLSKKNDLVYDLQKKVYLLGKEMDMGLIMKELKKKSDEESTNKDIHVLDGKLEKLFEFYKKLRKQLQQYMHKKGSEKDIYDNFSLTTKKLYSPNCLSCTPSPATRRNRQHYIKQRVQCSLDQSVLDSKNGAYLRPKKT